MEMLLKRLGAHSHYSREDNVVEGPAIKIPCPDCPLNLVADTYDEMRELVSEHMAIHRYKK